MVHRHPNCESRLRFNHRSGLIAITELLVVVAALIGLLWLGVQLASTVASDAASAGTVIAKGASVRGVNRISLGQDGERLWIYRARDRILQLDLATGTELQSVPLAGAELAAAAHSADGVTTLLCGINGSVLLWRNGADLPAVDVSLDCESLIEAAVSADGTVALCVNLLGQVVGWVCEGSNVRQFAYDLPGDSSVSRICLNRSGSRISVARSGGTISFHDATMGVVNGAPIQTEADCPAFAWSEDERLMAVASGVGIARTYDLATGKVVAEFHIAEPRRRGSPTAIAISPDGRRVAAAAHTSSEILIADVVSGATITRLSGHDGIVRSLQFSPNSNRLYSGSYDGTVREWSLESCKQLQVWD